MTATRAAMLWTGGKDSTLAYHKAISAGRRIECLVTFAPPDADFKAHPLALIRRQAERIGLPLRVIEIKEPYEDGYRSAIASLRDEHGITALITGDIAEVDGLPNWIEKCCQGSGVEVIMPLWYGKRSELMDDLLSAGFKAIITCVKLSALDANWVGRELNVSTVRELATTGIDLCGENGEYHSIVLDGPGFASAISLGAFTVHEQDGLASLRLETA